MWLIPPQDFFGNEEVTSNRIPCKRIEIELWLWAIKDSCASCMLHFLSMRLTIDEVLLNYSVISPERVALLEHCTSSHCAWPLYEVALRQITLQILKMELCLLCTALPLIALDHCMKLYWIPTTSFQVMHWTKKSNKGQ
jgi:hypothetical protein